MNVHRPWPFCWCGSTTFSAFGTEYGRCAACGTIVSYEPPPSSAGGVSDDARDFYGESYIERHQRDLGLPGAAERMRADLGERCCYWLATLLRYRLPPARLLELGCAHGGSVKLFAAAGFDAVGMEMSPAVVAAARAAFGIDVRVGPLERLRPDERFDVVVSFDVVEHLADPVATFRSLRERISPGGLLLVQTPHAGETSFESMRAAGDRFLEHLKPSEHVYLFTPASMRRLLSETGFPELRFEKPFFDYDMFFAASDMPLERRELDPQGPLEDSGDARIVRALLDGFERERTAAGIAAERLRVIEELKAACDERLALIETLDRALHARDEA